MANKKFSEFTSQTDSANVQFVVGYNGSDNVRISPGNLLGAYLPLAGGTMSGNTIHGDNVKSLYGTGSDLEILHDGSDSLITNNTGHLYISNLSDDRDIYFRTDDGSGGVATYMTVGGANEVTSFQKDTKHEDNVKAYFGNASDLSIYHDGSNSYISDTGTGSLKILAQDFDVKGEDTDNATIARFYSNTSTRGSFGIKNGVSVSPSIFIGTLGGSEQLAIGVNSTESIRINGSGNVGINATSPSEKLHVDGNIRVNSGTQGVYSSFIQAISSTGLKIGNDDFSGYAFFHNDGNTGIGTVTPTAKLQVVGLAEYADNSAATTAGLTAGAFYRTGDLLKVVH